MTTRSWTGEATRRTLLGDPTAQWQQQVKNQKTLEQVFKNWNIEINRLKTVPKEVQQAAALILKVTQETKPYRELAFNRIPHFENAYKNVSHPSEGIYEFNRELQYLQNTDLKYFYSGAHDIILATEIATDWIANVPPDKKYSVEFSTPLGKIILRGGDENITPPGQYLLIIDTGGSDTYFGGASNASSNNWVSVLIDNHGNDKYFSSGDCSKAPIAQIEKRKSENRIPAFGGALFGIAILVDAKGNDVYRSLRPSQGSGEYGVGVLLDKEGDDTYDAYVNSQGYGHCGIGILCDTSGNDKYNGFFQTQGCGIVRGVGFLLDGNGDDDYHANDEQLDFPSAQTKEHNVNMSQGTGFGIRADYSHGHSLGGGLGVLFDLSGNDKYSCGVFAQGVGYWQGMGILFDENGNDVYRGAWYVQGASAHFAFGALEDSDGHDAYTATMNMAQGAGHDFGIGFLIDRKGDDTHFAPNLSLGAGNANGIGVFLDYTGNDSYTSQGTTLGKANLGDIGTLREFALCLGLFIDLAGNDRYPDSLSWCGNSRKNVQWAKKNEKPAQSQFGVFWDE